MVSYSHSLVFIGFDNLDFFISDYFYLVKIISFTFTVRLEITRQNRAILTAPRGRGGNDT